MFISYLEKHLANGSAILAIILCSHFSIQSISWFLEANSPWPRLGAKGTHCPTALHRGRDCPHLNLEGGNCNESESLVQNR